MNTLQLQGNMNKRTFPDWLFSLITVSACAALALYMRIVLPFHSIFAGGTVRLTGTDSYYYMRLVDNLVHNFPQIIEFDPYMLFPGGDFITRVPVFFVYILAGAVKLAGGVSPNQQVIDSIAVFVPPLLGALCTIAMFFIGRTLVNRWAGLAAALTFALMPGELLARSLLGYTDHHVAEVFFTSFFAMFFILAVKSGRRYTYETMVKGQLSSISRHIFYSFLAGLFLGLYLITWQGALLFVFIIFIFFILQFISDYMHGFPSDYLSKIAITCFLFALLIFLPVSRDKLTLLALAILILVPIALNVLSSFMSARKVRGGYFLAVLAGLALVLTLVIWLVFPSLITTVFGYLQQIFSWKIDQTVVGEMKPLFFRGGFFSMETPWIEYGLILYSGLAGLVVLAVLAVRKGQPEHIFAAVWCTVMLLAALAMIRFTYYFGVCAALLTGYLAGWVIQTVADRQGRVQVAPSKKKRRKQTVTGSAGKRMTITVAAVAVAVGILITPGAVTAGSIAGNPAYMMPLSWMQALDWMKSNTPEPFGHADFYYQLYHPPEPGKSYDYPPTAYGVMIWSDYGYWLVRQGHRIPVANPAITHHDEAFFYTSQDEDSADKIMNRLGARYVIIDNRIVSPNDKFYAVAGLCGQKESDYYELCWEVKEDRYVPLLVFYPKYYRSMISRLYNFDGGAVTPQKTLVMNWEERSLPDGQKFKAIIGLKSFNTCSEAEAFISTGNPGNYSIIGTDPLKSPVPLEPLRNYKVVYQSEQKASAGSPTLMPEVKIFEYQPASGSR